MVILANVYSAVGVGLRDPLLDRASRSVTSCLCVQDSVPALLLFFQTPVVRVDGWCSGTVAADPNNRLFPFSFHIIQHSPPVYTLISLSNAVDTLQRAFLHKVVHLLILTPPPPLFVMPCTVVSCLNINQHACQGMSSFCFVDLRKAETTAVK